jgi:hypothetical protein
VFVVEYVLRTLFLYRRERERAAQEPETFLLPSPVVAFHCLPLLFSPYFDLPAGIVVEIKSIAVTSFTELRSAAQKGLLHRRGT